jgi:signal transduction histidine kinase
LETLANQVAIVVQNTHYMEAVRTYQEQQVEAERIAAIADVAGNMVHRINNAVGAIRPLIQQVEMKLDQQGLEEDYLREKLQRIKKSADQTLEVARQIRRPFQWVALQPIDVNESIAAAWADLKTPVGVKVSIKYDETLPPVTATRQLDEVFRNLMKNALDAMAQDGGVLVVRNRLLNDRWVEVIVGDTGPGIAPEIRDKIFHMGTTTKAGGTGFGLWWSRTFLRRLGGDMILEERDGRGCVFKVILPVSEEPDAG